MKPCLILTMLCLTCFPALADSHDDEGSSNGFRGTIGPVVKVAQYGNGVLTTLGGRANATLFNMFLLGVGGHASVAQSKLTINGISEDVSHYYGALGVGLRLFPGSFIHLTNYNNLGIGYLNLKTSGKRGLAYSIEPELNLEVDLFSLLRLGAGISYRFLFSKAIDVPSSALFGIGGQVFVEFGWL